MLRRHDMRRRSHQRLCNVIANLAEVHSCVGERLETEVPGAHAKHGLALDVEDRIERVGDRHDLADQFDFDVCLVAPRYGDRQCRDDACDRTRERRETMLSHHDRSGEQSDQRIERKEVFVGESCPEDDEYEKKEGRTTEDEEETITMTVVFIDTANAHPIISPAIALRHFMSLTRAAIAASQKTSQRSSVRYSSEPRKNVGKSAANTADHAAVVASNRRRAISHTRTIAIRNSGNINSRAAKSRRGSSTPPKKSGAVRR